MRGQLRGRGDPVYAFFCRLSVSAGLDPNAWLEMSLADFSRALARRSAS